MFVIVNIYLPFFVGSFPKTTKIIKLVNKYVQSAT